MKTSTFFILQFQVAADAGGVEVDISKFADDEKPNLDYWEADIDSIVNGYGSGTNLRGKFIISNIRYSCKCNWLALAV